MSRVVRTLAPGEVATLVGWAAAEGGNPGIADAEAFHAADPDGFLDAFVDGEMVAGISAVAYGADFGFIGLYICRPDMRGRGHGKAVWDAGMARLGGRTIGLDGEAAGQLLSAFAVHAGGPVQIDVPASQDAFIAILGDAGLLPGFSTARMYRGKPPRIDPSAVFGITSLELG